MKDSKVKCSNVRSDWFDMIYRYIHIDISEFLIDFSLESLESIYM